jgi:hypothetical protein
MQCDVSKDISGDLFLGGENGGYELYSIQNTKKNKG